LEWGTLGTLRPGDIGEQIDAFQFADLWPDQAGFLDAAVLIGKPIVEKHGMIEGRHPDQIGRERQGEEQQNYG
jgi:hypothetical protein